MLAVGIGLAWGPVKKGFKLRFAEIWMVTLGERKRTWTTI